MRKSGVLLHVTSIPGTRGIGDLGSEAFAFVDWLSKARQGVWQILPLGPTGRTGSPYDATSAFAGNPLLISVERLVEEGFVHPNSLPELGAPGDDQVDFARVSRIKGNLLRTAWDGFTRRASTTQRDELATFQRVHASWLAPWTLFAAIGGHLGQRSWTAWPEGLRRRDRAELASAERSLAEQIAFHAFVQFTFYRQWHAVRTRAHVLGIQILGDIPIYVSLDSADVWIHREQFDLDDNCQPRNVAGVPPDAFSATGQRWECPLYDWSRMESDSFSWWIERLRWSGTLFDLLRLDHFRGFVDYWAIPAHGRTAAHGVWRPGPGVALFEQAQRHLPSLEFIAEDLGEITDNVIALRKRLNIPGTRVLQFGFDSDDSDHHPDHVPIDCAYYTATHDNDTTAGWFKSLPKSAQRAVLDRLGVDPAQIPWAAVQAVSQSAARLAIAPAQDLVGLGRQHRMNTPGTSQCNWRCRLPAGSLQHDLADRLQSLTQQNAR